MSDKNMTLAERRAAAEAALRDFESACNTAILTLDPDNPHEANLAQAIKKARGDIREAMGEARS